MPLKANSSYLDPNTTSNGLPLASQISASPPHALKPTLGTKRQREQGECRVNTDNHAAFVKTEHDSSTCSGSSEDEEDVQAGVRSKHIQSTRMHEEGMSSRDTSAAQPRPEANETAMTGFNAARLPSRQVTLVLEPAQPQVLSHAIATSAVAQTAVATVAKAAAVAAATVATPAAAGRAAVIGVSPHIDDRGRSGVQGQMVFTDFYLIRLGHRFVSETQKCYIRVLFCGAEGAEWLCIRDVLIAAGRLGDNMATFKKKLDKASGKNGLPLICDNHLASKFPGHVGVLHFASAEFAAKLLEASFSKSSEEKDSQEALAFAHLVRRRFNHQVSAGVYP